MSSRRQFVLSSGASAIAASASAKTFTRAGDRDIQVGVMGLSRGLALAKDLTKLPGVVVKYVCDVDSLRM